MEMATGFWVGILAVVGGSCGGGMTFCMLCESPAYWWWRKASSWIHGNTVSWRNVNVSLSKVVFIEGDEHFTLLLLMIRIKLFLGVAFLELVGTTSLVAVQGSSHTRVRSFVMRAINQPDALHKIALRVQPRITVALESWAQKGRIRVYKEAKKVTFANIGKYFASLEPGLVLDTLDELFECLTAGLRFYPLNFPGTAFHRALQMLNFLPKAEGQGALWVGPTQDRLRLVPYIDFEISEPEYERTQTLYERFLNRTKHLRVWIGYAKFEASAMDEGLQESDLRESDYEQRENAFSEPEMEPI
ncbi:UNVERIFIED_CONTAM: Pre-splicing factor clf1 [Sesamum calycinum]|uniref:Pre-splicing factor clf1 n=1 Tax=Sesamum calycinum TaxID=2727403 RepID=A0AAW2KH80_9LAMI